MHDAAGCSLCSIGDSKQLLPRPVVAAAAVSGVQGQVSSLIALVLGAGGLAVRKRQCEALIKV